ncbi:MAG: replication initiator protein A [Verrucomicrobia bacterium]|nr:replication initiator protein A [Verrucomicrobiota bacterium]
MEHEKPEVPRPQDGKDELNLAEFPLSAIADRLDPKQKSLVFEDRVWDRNRGDLVTRQLLITAAEEYGLPTALDDEVILGLVQLSRLHGFAERRVPFTRYQLIQLLGWRDESKSYQRIEKSLNRWIGVTLYYQNAWWDREGQCWVDEKFHLLDNVTLFDREKYSHRNRVQTPLPISSFTWNEVVFRSFRAGNLKSLDFDFFKRLEGAVAKRLYRFLDKRFFHRPRWEFHLQELCWEHVGLARSYDAANLKRKLRPAIKELERHQFIRPASDTERFRKVSSGKWRVFFERAGRGVAKVLAPPSNTDALCQALIDRGVTRSTALETVEKFPREQIEHQLEVFDWLLNRKDSRLLRNPAGYLVSAIRSEYVAPQEFTARREQAEQKARSEELDRRRQARIVRERAREELKLQVRRQAVESFWSSFSQEERDRLETECLHGANSFERSLLKKGGTLGAATREKLFEEFALKSLAG